jgi:glucose-6-phosphate isomerase
MKPLHFDYTHALDAHYFSEEDLLNYQARVQAHHKDLHSGTGEGNEYTGWVDLPIKDNQKEIQQIQQTAKRIQNNCDAFVIIGIGGSYLGARAGIDMLCHPFHNELTRTIRKAPKIYFAGQNMSATYTSRLLELLAHQETTINVISKSGTTLESAIAFDLFRKKLMEKYGPQEAKNHIIVTTDKEKGLLKEFSQKQQLETFVVPDDIGGRYSVLSPVGLLPFAVAGIDIQSMLDGARDAYTDFQNPSLLDNGCYQYAALRNIFLHKEKYIEILATFDPCLFYFGSWFEQLFGESEGKKQSGLFPTSLHFTTDLHSLGQYMQEGQRILFETMITFQKHPQDIMVKKNSDSPLPIGKDISMNELNSIALQGVREAHLKGGVPVFTIEVEKATAYHFGYMVYFFEKACAMSSYLNHVNPFNQPGVEEYKKNIKKLLQKKK